MNNKIFLNLKKIKEIIEAFHLICSVSVWDKVRLEISNFVI
jgi:hypothetical protein